MNRSKLLVFSISLLLFLSGPFLLASFPSLAKSVQQNIPSELVSTNNAILNYLSGISDPPKENLSPSELSHLADVRSLFSAFRVFYLILLFLVIMATKKGSFSLKTLAKEKRFLTASFLSMLALFFLLFIPPFFQYSFYFFHILFFPRGNFTFPYSSTLITLYPETFFTKAILLSLFLSLFSFLGIRKSACND